MSDFIRPLFSAAMQSINISDPGPLAVKLHPDGSGSRCQPGFFFFTCFLHDCSLYWGCASSRLGQRAFLPQGDDCDQPLNIHFAVFCRSSRLWGFSWTHHCILPQDAPGFILLIDLLTKLSNQLSILYLLTLSDIWWSCRWITKISPRP